MNGCLCNKIHTLAKDYDDVRELIPALNRHLEDLRQLLTKAKSLAGEVQYQITRRNKRTERALFVDKVDLAPVDLVCSKFDSDVDGFWAGSNDPVHFELRRRLTCVVVFLRSKLNAQILAPHQGAQVFPGVKSFIDLRNSGRKYVQISQKLGGVGAIFWLPLSISPSTYERYLSIEDDDVFDHLTSLDPTFQSYNDLVQRLVLSQLCHASSPVPYQNLFGQFSPFIPAREQLYLVMYALGGIDIPETLLKSVRSPQRRWNAEGEVEEAGAAQFGLPVDLVDLLCNESQLSEVITGSWVTHQVRADNTVAWSLSPNLMSSFAGALAIPKIEELGITALKFICFVCPMCYEGNTDWSPSLKEEVWAILERLLERSKISASLRMHVLPTVLYFCERDSIAIRHRAVKQAKLLLRKSMPYYLHASVVLFRSILHRVDGELAKSEAHIREFMWRGPRPSTRRDHALEGRLHISQMNKIRCYDTDVPSFAYKWEAQQPLSTLDMEVTFRLQSTAARYFQSIGDFEAARASLEQFLSLGRIKPIPTNSRRVLLGRLADVYCEIGEYGKAMGILEPELERINPSDRLRRGLRRVILALVEAKIGLQQLDAAESALGELSSDLPPCPDDINDQQLYIRALLASVRIAHMRIDPGEAVRRWMFALEQVSHMSRGFIAAVCHLSLAPAQLSIGEKGEAHRSWTTGLKILASEKCEFWIPVVPTAWLQRVAAEIYHSQGWPFHMMLPGGKPDVTQHSFQIHHYGQ
ncbi:mfs multidrug transporter [Fusarium pseudocircinatum]|uniref:Mfs multidrug transporter n=1 Tax=Fusarium pseudocircinatum TaxID=56676 RepID=A0A8H5KS01_9HYPO|nr:mfs multidrug transporter [Fusarium pseudocircinatum]